MGVGCHRGRGLSIMRGGWKDIPSIHQRSVGGSIGSSVNLAIYLNSGELSLSVRFHFARPFSWCGADVGRARFAR